MVYQPVHQESPYRYRSAYGGTAQDDDQNMGIRSVQRAAYDAPDVLDDRPPSFHSSDLPHHTADAVSHGSAVHHGVTQPVRFAEDDVDDRDHDGFRRVPLQPDQYRARSDADLELRLNSAYLDATPAPSRPAFSERAGTYTPMHDDSGDEEHFEDSFEGDAEWDEKRQYDGEQQVGGGGLASPAVSFAGGFGAPPQTRQLRRNLTNRRVKLTQGNLVLDCAVPTRLKGFLPRKGDDEFELTRYTAITCDPEDFNKHNFTLRPSLYNRQTELFIVVTLYNESEILLLRSLHGIMKNISRLCERKKSQTWGADGWKKVVVCIVADGRKAIHPRVLDCLSALGVYQEGLATNQIDSASVEAHLYEYTTQMSITPELTFKGLEKGIVPTQIMFCLKEKNAKKLNSHRWALQAFAPQLDPNVVMLIDAGTKPGDKSLYHLWKAFDLNSNVGGACGEIVTMKGKFWTGLLNPLVAAQNFEYKISNILDKPTESIFGYITVLPGAFSAYRYRALQNDELGHGPLASYFKGEHLAGHDADVFTSNMYLAEDRILCWELVAKRGESWVLKFVKSAQGETDVPDTLVEFIAQRRRWLNGSFFASFYALTHVLQLNGTTHSRKKCIALYLQAIYNVLNLLFAWLGLANFTIFLMVLTASLEDPSFNLKGISWATTIVQNTYLGAVIAIFILSQGNKPKGAKWKYMIVMILLALTTVYMMCAAVYCVVQAIKRWESSLLITQIVVSLLSTYGCYVLASVIACDPWHLVTCMAQYILFSPIYIVGLNTYAFANLHDFSWGTKAIDSVDLDLGVSKKVAKDVVDMALPSDQVDIDSAYDTSLQNLKTRPMIVPPPLSNKAKEEAVADFYASVRTNVLLAWVLSNALLVTTILQGDYASTFSEGGGNGRTQIYLVIILVFVAIMSGIRFIGSTAYVLDRFVRIVGGRLMNRFRRKDVPAAKRKQGRGAAASSKEGVDESAQEKSNDD